MNFKRFLLDRAWCIAAFAASFGLMVAVAELDLMRHGITLAPANVAYVFVLGAACVVTALAGEYARQREWFRQLEGLFAGEQPDLDAVVGLKAAVTGEQRLFLDVLHRQHRVYTDTLTLYRRQQELHHHFVNRWVHHMKTPVSVIDLTIQQAERLPLPEEGRQLFASIREENERVAHGLEMMLHTARLEKFEMDVRVTRVDLVALVRRVVNDHKKACIRWSIYPRIASGEAAFWVETDEKWMEFVLAQIVSNAIKYSRHKPGDKALVITFERAGETGLIHVADEGIGIAEHDLPRVFDPFFTGENGRLTAESTGMGLFLARQVCRRLGHRISIRSELGAGTTVTVAFDLRSLYRIDDGVPLGGAGRHG